LRPIVIIFLKYYGFFNIYLWLFCVFVFWYFVLGSFNFFFFAIRKNVFFMAWFHFHAQIGHKIKGIWGWGHPSFWCIFFVLGNWRLCCLKFWMEKLWKRLTSCNHERSVNGVQSDQRLCFICNGFGWVLVLKNKKDIIKETINLNAWVFQQASLRS
jgi:hypothetical protein